MYVKKHDIIKDAIVVVREDGDCYENEIELLVDIYNNDDVNSFDMLNELAPVSYGNSYAAYEFAAIGTDYVKYAVGTNELKEFNEGETTLYPQELTMSDIEEIMNRHLFEILSRI